MPPQLCRALPTGRWFFDSFLVLGCCWRSCAGVEKILWTMEFLRRSIDRTKKHNSRVKGHKKYSKATFTSLRDKDKENNCDDASYLRY
eukprot:scaffold26639_cov151-Skeletonema_menzelii.AAC.3